MALPTFQGALKDGFVEAVMECDMPKPYKFPSLDSCQERLLWSHKGVDLSPHPVVGLAFRIGDAEKFLKRLVSKACTNRKQLTGFRAVVETGMPEM